MAPQSWFHKFRERKVGQTLAIYLGSAWVFIEAFNFIIDKYRWNTTILDIIILLVIFGLPAVVIYTWFDQKFTKWAIILQSINGIIAISLIGFNLINPSAINPTQLRLLKFQEDQKELAESIRSMVILPFDNFTGNDDYEYYTAGMHSALIGDMGKVSALRVISKTSSKAFRETDKSILQIASELGVDAVIEASVSCISGDSVCIQIQLVSAYPEEKQLWSKEYLTDKSQIENLYHKVTKEISEEINVMLTPQEEGLLAESKPVNPDAYELYLKGQFHLDQINPNSLNTASEYFKMAIQIDPDWAAPYTGLAETAQYQMQMGFVPPPEILPVIYTNLTKALTIDPNSATSHHVSAVIAVWTEWDWDKGEKEFQKAIELNSNNALSHIFYAHLLININRQAEAQNHCDKAIEIDPLRPFILGLGAIVKIDAGDYPSAIELCEKALAIESNHFFANAALEMSLYYNRDYDLSIRTLIKILSVYNFNEESLIQSTELVSSEEEYQVVLKKVLDKLEDVVKQGGFVPPYQMGKYYVRLNDTNKVLEWFNKGYQIHDPGMPYIATQPQRTELLKGNSEYIKLLKKMNLPLPK